MLVQVTPLGQLHHVSDGPPEQSCPITHSSSPSSLFCLITCRITCLTHMQEVRQADSEAPTGGARVRSQLRKLQSPEKGEASNICAIPFHFPSPSSTCGFSLGGLVVSETPSRACKMACCTPTTSSLLHLSHQDLNPHDIGLPLL